MHVNILSLNIDDLDIAIQYLENSFNSL
jgi:hypothetical protein